MKLLILDNNYTNQELKKSFKLKGLHVELTQKPSDFFAELDYWSPTHIVVNLLIPEVNGMDILAKLTDLNIKANIIITGEIEQQILQSAARSALAQGLNIIGTLQKPFNPSRLLELMDSSPQINTELLFPIKRHTSYVNVHDLIFAVNNQNLDVMYQPTIECKTGILVGFEVLARWKHPKLGNIPPDQFIELAEKNHLIDELTELVFTRALCWFSNFRYKFKSKAVDCNRVLCSINISALSLGNIELFDKFQSLCINHEIPADKIVLELTETGTMNDPIGSLDILTRLRIKGFNLSIDDFGTGFSSMLQLVRMPFSEVKIDKSFVMAVQHSREAQLVIKAIIDLAHNLGLTVTAEGVEDEQTLKFLQRLNCDKAQGNFISKPLLSDKIEQWLVTDNIHRKVST